MSLAKRLAKKPSPKRYWSPELNRWESQANLRRWFGYSTEQLKELKISSVKVLWLEARKPKTKEVKLPEAMAPQQNAATLQKESL